MKRAAIVSPDLFDRAERPLRERGFDLYAVPFCSRVDPRIGSHPDIQIFSLGDTVFVHPDLPDEFIRILGQYAEIIVCSGRLGEKYPADCSCNTAFTGKYALCRKDITAPEIISSLSLRAIPVIDIPQGYARCSILIIDEDTIATEDRGIASAAQAAGISTILIPPGSVPLRGFPRGFLGGASGSDGTAVYLTGSTASIDGGEQIRRAVEKRGKQLVELTESGSEDFGSILFAG